MCGLGLRFLEIEQKLNLRGRSEAQSRNERLLGTIHRDLLGFQPVLLWLAPTSFEW